MSTERVVRNRQREPTSIKDDLRKSPKQVAIIVGTHKSRFVSSCVTVDTVPIRTRHPKEVFVEERVRRVSLRAVYGMHRNTT